MVAGGFGFALNRLMSSFVRRERTDPPVGRHYIVVGVGSFVGVLLTGAARNESRSVGGAEIRIGNWELCTLNFEFGFGGTPSRWFQSFFSKT